ncbi:MAG TPA: ATPase, T2SS/T4P/T4SS family [Candidatus Eisenbacteria bacterium]|jgi:type IV pilus assembly protein PilB
MARDHKRLGDLLLEKKLITAEKLAEGVAEQKKSGQLLGATLIKMGALAEDALLALLQEQLSLPLVDLREVSVDEQVLAAIKEELAKKYLALPIEIEGRSTLVVAMADPLNVAALEDLRFHSGLFIKPVLASGSQISEAIERFYHMDRSMGELIKKIIAKDEEEVAVAKVLGDEEGEEQGLVQDGEGRPIIRLTNWLLSRACEERASDVHIEPQDHELLVRFRVDGLLREAQKLPKWTQGAIVSRIKVLSNLDIAEKRAPQDGRLKLQIGDRRVDMRVSTLPVAHGEKAVIRIVNNSATLVKLADLGFQGDDLKRFQGYLDRPQGIVLVTGPTGSGKSTLLYAALREIQDETINIVTVEDPVENLVSGINQVQVDEKGKKTFAGALRAILRQDPDVVMIGEIRDKETAQIAVRASVTGHLVLSTLHTNDAAGAVTRLTDLGLEPFMVASSLVGVVSVRLVRRLCPKCRETYEAGAASLNRFGHGGSENGSVTLYRGRGCKNCNDSGYHGRTGIFEVLNVDDTLRGLILSSASDQAIRQAAVEAGMRSIGEDGLRKVLAGITTLEEVARTVYLEEQLGRLCPNCKTVLVQEFAYCTKCGEFVGEHCESCRRRFNPEWTFCPFCGTGRSSGRARALPGAKTVDITEAAAPARKAS